MITKTWYDPCPRCGGEVTGLDYVPEYIRSNPEAVLSIRNPDCPYEDDPDADCTCTVFINPSPPAYLDEYIAIGATFTMQPCGDVIHSPKAPDGKLAGEMAGWSAYQKTEPEPGVLAALIDGTTVSDLGDVLGRLTEAQRNHLRAALGTVADDD